MKILSNIRVKRIVYSFILFFISTCSISAQRNSNLLGEWILVKQALQLYDGDKLVEIKSDSSDFLSLHILNFKTTDKVDYIFEEKSEIYPNGLIEFKYLIKGKGIYFESIKGDAEDMNYVNYKINNDSLYLYLEVIDDSESDYLKNPNLREEYVYERKKK